MTELEQKIDNEVGNDTEQSRVNFLKYVNYGRQLQLEATNSVTREEMTAAVSAAEQKVAKSVMDEVDALLGKTGYEQLVVERDSEDAPFNKIKTFYATDAKISAVIKEIEILMDDVDSRHEKIVMGERVPGLAAIRAKYVKQV